MLEINLYIARYYKDDKGYLNLLDHLAQLNDDRKLAELLGKKERELKSKA